MRRYFSTEIVFTILFFLLGAIAVFFDIYQKNQIAAALRVEAATAEAFEAESENEAVASGKNVKQITFTGQQSAWVQVRPCGQEGLEGALIRHKMDRKIARQIEQQIRYFARVTQKGKADVPVFLHQRLGSEKIICDKVVFFTENMQKGSLSLKNGRFKLLSPPKSLPKTTELYSGVVERNFYSDAQKSSVDHSLIEKSMMIFRHVLDFQRDICVGDSFTILAEKSYDKETGFVGNNTLLYSAIQLKSRKLAAYRFVSNHDKKETYLDEMSLPLQRELLVTPVRGARISSRYGNRTHPIRGYTRFHPGVDFAARTGTPVLAAGHGSIKKMVYTKGYGNLLMIAHDKGYTTLYAHLHRFSPTLRKGQYVQQGAVVGYVGSTGESTGPHLHYEVHHKGKRINPQKVNKLPPAPLRGTRHDAFLQQKLLVDQQLELLRST